MKQHAPTRTALTLGLAAGAALASCANPLAPIEDDYGVRVARDRLRSIDALDPAPYRRADPTAEEIARYMERPSSRFDSLNEVPLTLESVRAATLENNLDLRVALVDPVIQSERLRQEEARFEAVFRPSVRVFESDRPTFNVTDPNQQEGVQVGAGVDIPLRTGGRISVDLVEGRNQTNNPFVTLGTSYTADTTISISQPLLRNAGRRASTYAIRVAAYDDQIAQARAKLEVIRQLAAADRAYWRLYAARRDLEVAQRQYELAVAQLERAQARVRAGDAPQIEITRAEAGIASQLEAILNAENVLLLRQRELKRTINIPGLGVGTDTLVVTATEPDPVRYEFDGRLLTEQALANRMEMLELELRLASDLSTIEFTKNQALPLFTLDYAYSINGLGETFRRANTQMGQNNFESWTLSLNGQIPIGNEAAKARVQQAILARLQRLSTRDARMQAIEQEVLNAIDVVDLGWKRILAARQAAITAARTLEAERIQFDAGARTSTDVLDAATRLADAQRAEVRAIADYEIGLVDLGFATGTLLGVAKLTFEPFDPRGTLPAEVVDPVPSAFPPAGPGPSYREELGAAGPRGTGPGSDESGQR